MTTTGDLPFPEGFLWGAATASYQIEGAADDGGRSPSVWDTFSHTPGKVAHGHTGDVACDHYNRMEDDVALMASLGLKGYRFSISWSRVIPDGVGPLNQEGVDFYSRLVDRLLEHDITPLATLFHWDLPQVLEDKGGFRNRDVAGWFADYSAAMVDQLGDRVKTFATFNEPWVYAHLGHYAGYHAPGLTDAAAAVSVAHHELLAHGQAVEAMRAARDDLQIGIVINATNVVSKGEPPAPAGEMAFLDGLHNRWWYDTLLGKGHPADVVERLGEHAAVIEPGDAEIIAQPIDWIGLNYYSDALVRGREGHDASIGHPEYPMSSGIQAAEVQEVHTDMDWPITPDGLTNLLVRLHDEYPNLPPTYVTENGCAYDDPVVDGEVDDTRRIDYLDQHLRALAEAIARGVDVRGYFQWSLLDNFEWALGYDKRFGIVHIDFDTLERTPKNSAFWYRDVISRGGPGQ